MSDEIFYIYGANGTWIRGDDELEKWRESGKKYFCLSWQRTTPRTLPEEGKGFIMYMRYNIHHVQNKELQGKIEFKLHVKKWMKEKPQCNSDSIYFTKCAGDISADNKVWFIVDKIERVKKTDGEYLILDDFTHPDSKKTIGLRNTIPKVKRISEELVIETYAHNGTTVTCIPTHQPAWF
jgi:hypothetical protein